MTTSESKTVKNLKEKVTNQDVQISRLRARVSELVDDILLLQNEVKNFKVNVSSDLKEIVESISNK